MTLQETEQITGLRRTSIRRYERLGFIHTKPERTDGRTYTEEQVKILLRVRLLRQLMVPEVEIRKVQKGYYNLKDVLQCCLEVFAESPDLKHARDLKHTCEEILSTDATFETLNAYPYLVRLQGKKEGGMYKERGRWWLGYWIETEPEREYPKRRFWARMIDCMLLWMILIWVIYVEFSVQPSMNVFCLAGMWGLHTVLYLLLDASFITLFGATPGKFLTGIRVYTLVGNYFTWEESLRRSFRVIAYGMGWNLPVWNLWCMMQSERVVNERLDAHGVYDTLEWENEDWYEYKCSEPVAKGFAYAAMGLLAIGILAGWDCGSLPVYRGDITIREFATNRNTYAKHYDATPWKKLSPVGKWVRVSLPGLQDFADDAKPESNYYYVPDKDRILREIVYQEYYQGTETVQMNVEELEVAVYAFLGAKKSMDWSTMQIIGKNVYDYADSNYEIHANSIRIIYEIVLDGMNCERTKDGWQISPKVPGQEGYYSAKIQIILEDEDEGTNED